MQVTCGACGAETEIAEPTGEEATYGLPRRDETGKVVHDLVLTFECPECKTANHLQSKPKEEG